MKSKRGMTMLELILAMAILAAAIIPIMMMGPNILKSKKGSEEGTRAALLAARVMEETRGMVMHSYAGAGGGGYSTGGFIAFTGTDSDYSYDIVDDNDAAFKTISVTVHHNDNTGNPVIIHSKIAFRTGGSWNPSDRTANFSLLTQSNWIGQGSTGTAVGSLVDTNARYTHDIRAKYDAAMYVESVTVNNTNVNGGGYLTGGYDTNFSARVPNMYSTIKGKMHIQNGKVKLKWIHIIP